jgi:N-acetylglucosaminyl-diphospho-decaprenol L-rhamnosyltransferase
VTEPVTGLSLRSDCRVVIVNWNSGPRLARSVQSIPAGFEITIVDNASEDPPAAFDRVGAVVIANSLNAGFAGAANAGADGCRRSYLLFLNPDVSFAAPDSADAMLTLLDRDPSLAAATGLLAPFQPGARAEAPLARPLPTLRSALADVLFVDEVMTLVAPPPPAAQADGPVEIEQAPGACLLIRTEVFRRIGGFDAAFHPAWFEDVDLCRRLRDRGYRIMLEPRSLFFHEGGYSLEPLGSARFYSIFYGNMVRYFRKHHGPAAAGLLRTAVLFGNAVRRLRGRF